MRVNQTPDLLIEINGNITEDNAREYFKNLFIKIENEDIHEIRFT